MALIKVKDVKEAIALMMNILEKLRSEERRVGKEC